MGHIYILDQLPPHPTRCSALQQDQYIFNLCASKSGGWRGGGGKDRGGGGKW